MHLKYLSVLRTLKIELINGAITNRTKFVRFSIFAGEWVTRHVLRVAFEVKVKLLLIKKEEEL